MGERKIIFFYLIRKSIMWLQKLQLNHFKNHHHSHWELEPGWVCISGPNGIGKTNILDSIWMLAYTRSYFSVPDKDLIQKGAPGFSVLGELQSQSNLLAMQIRLEEGKRKQLFMELNPVSKISDWLGVLDVIMITPFDIHWVYEGAEVRRKFIDQALCKCFPEYLSALQQYKKALENRNKQLKIFGRNSRTRDPLLLEHYDHVLNQTAPRIFAARQQFCSHIGALFKKYYAAIAGSQESVQISYKSHLSLQSMASLLVENMERDFILERTTKGVHSDDIEFSLNEMSLKKFGSQGQTKSFVIALQLALYEWFTLTKATQPVLLLDDIFEKIDERRSESLMEVIEQLNPAQVFVTDTHQERIQNHMKPSFNTQHISFNGN